MNNIVIYIDEKTGELIDASINISSLLEFNEYPLEIHIGDKVYKTEAEGEPRLLIQGIPFLTCNVQKVNYEA